MNSELDKSLQQDEELIASAKSRVEATRAQAHADNTRIAYNQDFHAFMDWCLDQGFEYLPASPCSIELFLESQRHLKLSTLLRRVSGINLAHRKAGYPKPADQGLKEYLKGLRNSRKAESVTKAKAIRKAELLEICKKLYDTGKPKDLRDRTIILCAWFGAFRRAELAAMTWRAAGAETLVKVEQGYTYLLRHSKSDQSGEGKIKILPYQSQVEICPVRALDALKEISEGNFVFMGMSKSGKILHNSMSDKAVDRVVKKYFGPTAKAHGLRAGFITEAAVKGNSLHSIANQTGHKNLSTLRGYVREVDAWENNAALNV